MKSIADLKEESIERYRKLLQGQNPDDRNKGFTQISNPLIANKKLTPQEKFLYVALKYFNSEEKGCYPRQDKLSKILNLSERQIIRLLKPLIKEGFLKKYKSRRGNFYRFLK